MGRSNTVQEKDIPIIETHKITIHPEVTIEDAIRCYNHFKKHHWDTIKNELVGLGRYPSRGKEAFQELGVYYKIEKRYLFVYPTRGSIVIKSIGIPKQFVELGE